MDIEAIRVYLCKEAGKGRNSGKVKRVLRWQRADGSRAKKSLGYISAKAAEIKRRNLETEININGEPEEQAENQRRKALRWDVFVTEYMQTKTHLTYSHRNDIEKSLKDFARLANVAHVQKITRGTVQRYYSARCGECKPITANRQLQNIAQALDYAVAERLLNFNPCNGVSKGKVEAKAPHGLTDTEVQTIRDKAPSKEYKVFYGLCLGCGCRRVEGMRRVWGDIIYQNGNPVYLSISNTKDREPRTIPIPPWLAADLNALQSEQRQISPTAYICPTLAAMHPDTVSDESRLYFDAINQPKTTIQALRRTFGVRVRDNGAKPFELQAMLGHSSVTCSERWYTGTPSTAVASLPPVVYNTRREPESKAVATG